MIAYDRWCDRVIAVALLWLEEWLSIKQKAVERFIMGLYTCILLSPSSWRVRISNIALAAFMLGLMWSFHRRPAAERGVARRIDMLALWRALLQLTTLVGSVIEACLLPYNMTLVLLPLWIVFIYVTDISNHGHPGRRRKLALAELKKLFGTEWMPKPASMPS